MKVRTLDLFCGGGGSSWGARSAGADIVCGVDAWELATRTFAANFATARALNLTLDEESTPSLMAGLGGIDLILASPECTHHTCARGARPRDEGSRRSARFVLKFARDLAPRWVVIENVVHMRRWAGYEALVAELAGLGYHVHPQVLDAAEFGVPQKRRRLFLLCDREAPPLPVAAPLTQPAAAGSHVVIHNADWTSSPLYRDRRAPATIARAERAMAVLGRGTPFLIVYYGTDGGGGWQPLDRPIRTLTTLDRFGLVTWDGNMPMLRMLQPPELQRAMGFPGAYALPYGSRRDCIRLLGNAVCPPVMEAVVRTLVHRQPMAMAAE